MRSATSRAVASSSTTGLVWGTVVDQRVYSSGIGDLKAWRERLKSTEARSTVATNQQAVPDGDRVRPARLVIPRGRVSTSAPPITLSLNKERPARPAPTRRSRAVSHCRTSARSRPSVTPSRWRTLRARLWQRSGLSLVVIGCDDRSLRSRLSGRDPAEIPGR